jgi:hypothetical protein
MPRAGNGLKLPCPGPLLGRSGCQSRIRPAIHPPSANHLKKTVLEVKRSHGFSPPFFLSLLRASSVSVQRRSGQPVMGFRFPFPVSVRSAVWCRRAATWVLEESGYMLGRCQDAQVQRDGHTRQKKNGIRTAVLGRKRKIILRKRRERGRV